MCMNCVKDHSNHGAGRVTQRWKPEAAAVPGLGASPGPLPWVTKQEAELWATQPSAPMPPAPEAAGASLSGSGGGDGKCVLPLAVLHQGCCPTGLTRIWLAGTWGTQLSGFLPWQHRMWQMTAS